MRERQAGKKAKSGFLPAPWQCWASRKQLCFTQSLALSEVEGNRCFTFFLYKTCPKDLKRGFKHVNTSPSGYKCSLGVVSGGGGVPLSSEVTTWSCKLCHFRVQNGWMRLLLLLALLAAHNSAPRDSCDVIAHHINTGRRFTILSIPLFNDSDNKHNNKKKRPSGP